MPEPLNSVDYFVVILYLLMVVTVGIFVSRFNKNTTDYFKGGGHIPWVLSAVSLFVSGFSAFMFVGAAGFTYRNGSAAILLFTSAFPAYLLGYFLYGWLWRRTRIDTPMEFLTRRYSPGTTYTYTLISVVPNVLGLGIAIYTLCIFIATALGFSRTIFDFGAIQLTGLQLTMVVTGIVLVIYTMLGGLWAVIVTDALQFVILFLATLLILPLGFILLGDGSFTEGLVRLVSDAPDGFWGFKLHDRPPLFWVAYFLTIVLGYNVNWHIAQRYYSVADERDTKKMALWCAGLSIVLPLMWILPVMASRILFPDLASLWQELAEPTEASFVTLALTVLPHGMLGVMVAAMFAATMSSADTTFNWLAAVLTKDAYVPLYHKATGRIPTESAQLLTGKLTVAVMGVVSIWVALNMESLGGVFDVQTKATSLYTAPMFIPVLLGLVYTKTPWWSGMASMVIGVVAVIVFSLGANIANGLPANSFSAVFLDINLTWFGMEVTRYELQTLVGVISGVLAFFTAALFYKRKGSVTEAMIKLEQDLATPAYATELERVDLRGLQAYLLTGRISVILGGLLILMALPSIGGDKAPLNLVGGIGAIILGIGIVVWAKRFHKTHPVEPDGVKAEYHP